MGPHVPARWRHLLWLLVLVRLLVPVSALPPSPVSIQNLAVVDQPVEQVRHIMPIPQSQPTVPDRDLLPEGTNLSEPPVAPAVSITYPPSQAIPWWPVAAGLWLAGVLASLAATLYLQLLLRGRLRKNRVPVDDEVLAIWNQCRRRIGVKRSPALWMSPSINSPALVGLFLPVLLLPDASLATFSARDWENIFVHELAHYRRRDHWTHALQLAALALHWFNPIIWFGFRQMRADRELAADEWALRHLEPERSGAYGDTLIKILAQSAEPAMPAAVLGILEDRVQLKQRLQRIMSFGSRPLLGSAFGFAIVLAVALVALGRTDPTAALSDYGDMSPQEVLVKAAQFGDLPAIRQALQDKAGVNAVLGGPPKQTALASAAGAGQMAAVTLLLSTGADINKRADGVASPVQAALENGRSDVAAYLLAHGAVCAPPMTAAYKGDLTALAPFLAKDPADLGQLKMLCGIAAANGHADAYLAISEKIRIQPGETDWALGNAYALTAIARGHRDVVQAIIDTSDLGGLNKNGAMRISGPASESPGMREWLVSKGFVVPPYTDGERLVDATEQEDLPEMARLLKAGVDVNYRGESSWTPITKAAAWNKVHAVKFLLAHGADPNSVHLPGWDYSSICLTTTPAIADMLLAAGANINATLYKRGVHIMDYAVTFGATDMVKWYIAHGVDPVKAGTGNPGRSLLYDAGNAQIAEILIEHGVDPKAKDKDGSTALHWICRRSKTPAEVAEVLLKHGADPNAQDKYGDTPLMLAKDGATVDVLIKYGADIKVKNRDGQTVMDSFPNWAEATRLEALIRHGAPFDPKKNGPTMMVAAAWLHQADIVKVLLDHGVDPNAEGYFNEKAKLSMLPIEAAVTDGGYDAAKILVDHGAQFSGIDPNGQPFNCVTNALRNRHIEMTKLFWDLGDRSISELCYQVSQGAPVAELEKLLANGAPADPPLDTEMTPLAEAAQLGRLDAVQLLVTHGASVNGLGINTGNTPLMMAAREGQDEIVDFLLKHGAQANRGTLAEAVSNSNPYPNQRSREHFQNTVKLLIDAGVIKNQSKRDGESLLGIAIFTRNPGGNIQVAKMLLQAGASFNDPYYNGKTVSQAVHDELARENTPFPSEMLAFLTQALGKPAKNP